MARRLFTNRVGDIGFSRNAWRAYCRGERPLHMFTSGEHVVPTIPHHIEVPYQIGGLTVQRKLVMFYRAMKHDA